MPCYLDNSATTQPTEHVIAAMQRCMAEEFFNPSALYAPAVTVEKRMQQCRDAIKRLIGCDTVLFTSGGTEANNLAIQGALRAEREKGVILYSAGEHPSVKEACIHMETEGFTAKPVPYTADGLTDLDALKLLMTDDVRMICLMQVNNETGAVQPLQEVADMKKQRCPGAHFHVDGVQGFLRCPIDMRALGVDSYSLSGHKIHAPKGIGALALGNDVRLMPLMFGGGQENAIRSGTENTPGIAGLLAAIEEYPTEHGMRTLKLHLYERIKERMETLAVNGPDPYSTSAAPHILNLSFPPVRAETLLHALEGAGIYVGNGSACSSKKKQTSPVLKAMGVSGERAESAIRFSLNPFITREQIEEAADAVVSQYRILKRFQRR